MEPAREGAVEARRVWREAVEWLTGFRWQGYMILTFAKPPGAEGAAALSAGVDRVAAGAVSAGVRVRVGRSWRRHGALDAHALVGGLFEGSPPPEPHYSFALAQALDTARMLWTHGQVPRAARYDPRGGAVPYMTQPATWGEDEAPGMLYGEPIRKSHRRSPVSEACGARGGALPASNPLTP